MTRKHKEGLTLSTCITATITVRHHGNPALVKSYNMIYIGYQINVPFVKNVRSVTTINSKRNPVPCIKRNSGGFIVECRDLECMSFG